MALLRVLRLLLLPGVSVNSDVSVQKRIIGGHDCDNQEHLYYIRIMGRDGRSEKLCGGSLIHPKWILTAAHCWNPGWIFTAMLKVHPLTTNYQNLVIRNNPVIYAVDGRDHDIMLIKLPTPVTDVPLAQLPNCNNRLKVGDIVQLAGEGSTRTGPNNQRLTNSPLPLRLQCVDMKVFAVSQFKANRGHMFYTKEPNKDMCRGDSGSGVVFNNMIYGVLAACGKDAFQKAVGIMDVCEYKDWIKKITGLK